MTKDEVLKLIVSVCDPDKVSPVEKDGMFVVVTPDELLAFANAIADLQREKDANIVEELKGADWYTVSEAIRANKE